MDEKICPFMSTPEAKVKCTSECRLWVDNVCAISDTQCTIRLILDKIKEKR